MKDNDSDDNNKKPSSLSVRIITLGELIWEGEAESITAENTTGIFDILPRHANFITILKQAPIKIQTKKEEKEFVFPRALLYANNNTIKIYAGV